MTLVDRAIVATDIARVGVFRCTPDDPSFASAGGPVTSHLVVFPRTGVWIEREDAPPCVADPTRATLYNRGQSFHRRPLCSDGDRSDWYGLSTDAVNDVRQELGLTDTADTERPFTASWAPVSMGLYVWQRHIWHLASAGLLDGVATEESVMTLFACALSQRRPGRRRITPRTARSHYELAMGASAALACDPSGINTVRHLAASLGVSPFHLCRVFRQETGRTLHGYRLDLRLHLGLELLERRARTIAEVAVTLGFCSHSHYVVALRRRLGMTPTEVRSLLFDPRSTGLVAARLASELMPGKPHAVKRHRSAAVAL